MTGPESRIAITSLPSYRPRQAAKLPPCQDACPVGGDVRGWIGVIAQRRRLGIDEPTAYTRAWQTITDVNPFPAVLGRICPHPCEGGCNRNDKDAPVAINALERFLGDWAIDQRLPLQKLEDAAVAASIGVIGAGPSGLSFAYQMARRGYPVTVYEQRALAGGMLRFGVPDYRLPPEILDAEIARITDLGVEIRLGVAVGRDVTIDELRDRHDLVYLGIGAQRGRPLGIPGEEGPGVLSGIDYLGGVNRGTPADIGTRVAVIGGGNTAVDTARTARRTGARVTMLYRRGRDEMPAVDEEIEEAEAEGVEIRFLVAPIGVQRHNGAVSALVVQGMELGAPDASGRRRPVPVAGSEFEMDVDTVIAAVSQEPDWSLLDGIRPDDRPRSLTEIDAGMWIGGDAAGPDIAGVAIAHGRYAAEVAHSRLSGRPVPHQTGDGPIGPDRIKFDHRPNSTPVAVGKVDVETALGNAGLEVNLGISEPDFLSEVERCFSCGLCFGCTHCFMYCTASSFTPVADPTLGVYFTMDLEQCRECGKCIEVCPCGYLEVTSPPA